MSPPPSHFPPLNVAAFAKDSRVMGPGLRDALWLQGCTLDCPGCANQAFLAHRPRILLTVERLLAHFAARRGRIDGLSVSGGEPSEQPEALGALLAGVRELGLSTVVYSGRTLEALRRDPRCAALLAHTDLLIDGPYVASQRDPRLLWRGSRNQRLLRLSERFRDQELIPSGPDGEIVLHPGRITLTGIGTLGLAINPRGGR